MPRCGRLGRGLAQRLAVVRQYRSKAREFDHAALARWREVTSSGAGDGLPPVSDGLAAKSAPDSLAGVSREAMIAPLDLTGTGRE